jgi:hypothetical protein
MIFVLGIWAFVHALFVSSAAVSLENVALRHQHAVLQRSVPRRQTSAGASETRVSVERLQRRLRLLEVEPISMSPYIVPAMVMCSRACSALPMPRYSVPMPK